MAQPPFIDARNADCGVKEGEAWMRPVSPRDGCRVEPLIEAADMFPRLEHLVLDAKRRVWLSFRIFDPETKTRSDRCKELGLADWAELIEHAVRRGIEVRILLADFEPVLADYLHAGSWSTYRSIRAVVERLDPAMRERLQLIVIQHEGEMGWGARQALRLVLRGHVRKVVAKLLKKVRHEDGGFDTRPGLWRYLKWERGKPKAWKPAPPPRLWPATYHQKFVVIDPGIAEAEGGRTIIGGLDLDERRWDDRRHHQRANQTWHDISALIAGPVVMDAGAHFARLWNRELPRYRSIVEHWTSPAGRALMLDPLTPIPALPGDALHLGEAQVQMLRTQSIRSAKLFATGPRPCVRELKAAHRSLILGAERLLYIEAQFFRSHDAANWVEEALRNHPELHVIILVANTPEEIAFEAQVDNLAHRHGEYLQARALGRLLKKAGSDRLGIFTLAKHERVSADEKKFEETRGTAFGSGLIHIHAKLLVADDRACLLSSANINGRSFEWDTELGILWSQGGEAIAEFRRRLWSQLFGCEGDTPVDLTGWREIAEHNAKADPEQRKGFVLPYQLGRARRYGKPYFFIPDDLV